MTTWTIQGEMGMTGTVTQTDSYGLIWHIIGIPSNIYYGIVGDIPATYVKDGIDQIAIIRYSNNMVYLDEGLTGGIGEVTLPVLAVNITYPYGVGSTGRISLRILPPGVTLISPAGSDPDIEMTCVNVIALVQNGQKWWLTRETYTMIGHQTPTEVSLSEFHSYPDGIVTIIINEITIPPRSTASICPIGRDSEKSNLILYGVIVIAALGIGYSIFKRKQ